MPKHIRLLKCYTPSLQHPAFAIQSRYSETAISSTVHDQNRSENATLKSKEKDQARKRNEQMLLLAVIIVLDFFF